MTDERRQNPTGRRQGKDRRQVYSYGHYSTYAGVERRAGDRRSGVSRRAMR